MEDEKEIRYPSYDERRKVLLAIAAVIFVGFVCLALFQIFEGRLYDLHRASPEKMAQELQIFIKTCSLISLFFMAGLSLWLWALGSKIKKTGAFPPPGIAIVKPVTVRRGKDAELYGKIARFLSLIFLAFGLGLAVLLWRLALLAA